MDNESKKSCGSGQAPDRRSMLLGTAAEWPIKERLAEHIKSLIDFPPVQGSSTLSVSKLIEETVKKGSQ